MSAPHRVIQDGLREELIREVGRSRWRLWFRDTEVRDVSADGLTLAVPSEVHRTWFEYTYADVLRRAAENVLGEGVHVRLHVSERQGLKREIRDKLPNGVHEWEACVDEGRPRPTFATWVSDGAERFPLLLLGQFVHGNDVLDPPAVYLYGERGAGKTHLLSALASAVQMREPGDAAYLTAQTFTDRYVAALRTRELGAIRAFELDLSHRRLVLLDDLDRLAGRDATQRALVRLREKTLGTGTRFVFASRRHPQDLEHFSRRLRSWLMGGVVLPLAHPDEDRLSRILRARARAWGTEEPSVDVLEWIRVRTGSVHGAIEVLDRWAAGTQRVGFPLGPEWLEEISPTVTVRAREEIVRRAKMVTAEHFGLSAEVFECATKMRRAAEPRRIAMYLVYRATPMPFIEIAHAFGLKGHSSASRAITTVRDAREQDPALEQVIDGLLARM